MTFSRKLTGKSIFSLTALLALFVNSTLVANSYYQIKVYNVKDEDQEARVEAYLKEAYVPAMHRAGVEKVGVFKPVDNDSAAAGKIFVLIPLNELGQIETLDAKLEKDKRYQRRGADYINASWETPPYERMESILLKGFSKMPELRVSEHSTSSKEQVYELRSYEGPTEKMYRKKVEMFNDAGEIELFDKLGFNAVFYGEVLSGSVMPNLMYMTSFSDMESREVHWDAFRNSADWKKLSSLQEYKNTVSNSVKYLLHPTEYSDI